MQGIKNWSHQPYRPYNKIDEASRPFICRLAPGRDNIELEWLVKAGPDSLLLFWRKRDSQEAWQKAPVPEKTFCLTGLEVATDYEFYLLRQPDQAKSALRYARTGPVPGTVVNYLHPYDKLYDFSGHSLCSPSLVKLPDGSLLASMDVFAPRSPQNLTIICRSQDGGRSWHYLTDLFPCFWGSLFLHRGRLYMLACSTEYGDLLIAESSAQGQSWSAPVRLFAGSGSWQSPGWHRAPLPLVEHEGYLVTSIDYGAWHAGGHSSAFLSIDATADLLQPQNWSCSGLTAYDPAWPGAPADKSSGIIEGNVVVGPDGRLYDILRLGLEKTTGLAVALILDIKKPEKAMEFSHFAHLPSGSNSKSYILQDPVSKKYLAIGNICVDPATPAQRNVLALQASADLVNWQLVKILLDYRQEDPAQTGFQYITFIIDGPDILYLSRTALNGARNFHDANYITLHKLEDFRSLLEL